MSWIKEFAWKLTPLARFVQSGIKLEEATATGNPASFETDVKKELAGLTIPISNESGISGLEVHRAGYNVWDEDWEKGSLNGSGANNPSNENIRSKGFIPVVPGQKYYVRYLLPSGGASSNMRIFYYDENKAYKSNSWVNPSQITVPSGAHYMRFYMDSRYGTTYINNIGFNYPSTETAYHAYEGESHSLDFGESVSAGSLDAVNGILTVTAPASKTIQLSPLKIKTAVGRNNVFTDKGGSNTVKYLKKA